MTDADQQIPVVELNFKRKAIQVKAPINDLEHAELPTVTVKFKHSNKT